jgi:polysaccharide deacetylase 2 family uncharacterized protein YibQ
VGLLLCLALAPLTTAAEPPPAKLALIIDDLGDRWDYGQRALALPGAVTYAILPGTPHGLRIARLASEEGRDVMLHQPMEALEASTLGTGALDSRMSREQFLQTLRTNLDALPQVRGINNHMGSRLTRDTEAMVWLMAELRRRGGLYFVDSRTISDSVAQRTARHEGVATIGRDVFLDHVRTTAAIEKQLVTAMKLARARGKAVAIGHPHPETLTVLEAALPRFEQYGVTLVSVSQLIETKKQRSNPPWHVSLFPLPTAAKN